jgi:hypothetical protein
MVAQFTRDWAQAGNTVSMGGFVGDQISFDRLTLNLGLRYGRGTASLASSSVPANPWTPMLGALTSTAQKDVFVNDSVTPRVGLTYALNESRKTIARASYGMFAGQLDSTRGYLVSQIPGTNTGSGYVYWLATDLNGNGITDPNELAADGFLGTVGFDPTDPLGGNKDRFGDYATPLTHEVVLGLEHELRPNLGISAAFTWRYLTDFNWTHSAGVTGSDYLQTGSLTGTQVPIGPFNTPIYTVNPAAVPDDRGRVQEKRDGYHQRYRGLEIAATKRMSNNWMMRVGWSTNDHREYFDNLDARFDPTPALTGGLASPNKDGGYVLTPTGGSGKSNIYMVLPKYQYIMNAAYQAKYNITLGMNYLFRQGYSTPFYRSGAPGSADLLSPAGKNVLLVGDVGEYRLPNVHSLDGRLSWALRIQNRASVHFDLDIFNMFNNGTVLGKQINLSSATTFNQVREIMNPRIIRLGARLTF